jgi:hypothetical protein
MGRPISTPNNWSVKPQFTVPVFSFDTPTGNGLLNV